MCVCRVVFSLTKKEENKKYENTNRRNFIKNKRTKSNNFSWLNESRLRLLLLLPRIFITPGIIWYIKKLKFSV